jgi:hypothetical protein
MEVTAARSSGSEGKFLRQKPILVRIAVGVLLGDGRAAARDKAIVEKHCGCAGFECRVETAQELSDSLTRYVRPPEAGKPGAKRRGLRRKTVCIANNELHFLRRHARPSDLKRLWCGIDGNDASAARGEELCPVASAARDLEHRASSEDAREPLLDLPKIRLALRLPVDLVVLCCACCVVVLHRCFLFALT